MAIAKLKTVFTTGAWLTKVKTFYDKINEIIDYLNGTGSSDSGSYKKYVVSTDQVGVAAPTGIVFENTLRSTPTWSYSAVGLYYLNCTGAFKSNKTIVFLSGPKANALITPSIILAQWVSEDQIAFMAMDVAGGPNNSLFKTDIEIRVYN